MTDCVYTVLGLDKNVSQETIKQTYRKLCQEHHPDKGGEEELFKRIKSAYDKISSKEKREQYDSGWFYEEQTTESDFSESRLSME